MDDAKKMLDLLMGQARNQSLQEAKAKKGQNFKEDDVCKFYLLGFCPQQEQLFKSTKRHLGACSRTHSDAMKAEFDAHPDREKFAAQYAPELRKYLETIIRTADDSYVRETRIIRESNKELEVSGPNDIAKEEIAELREKCTELLAEAEKLAESGDIEGSKAVMALHAQAVERANHWEEKSKVPASEYVCEICGLRPVKHFVHTEGKIHVGLVKVRLWVKKLEEKYGKQPSIGGERDRERSRDHSRSRVHDRRDRSRDRDHDRDRHRKSKHGRSPVRSRGRERDRCRSRSRR